MKGVRPSLARTVVLLSVMPTVGAGGEGRRTREQQARAPAAKAVVVEDQQIGGAVRRVVSGQRNRGRRRRDEGRGQRRVRHAPGVVRHEGVRVEEAVEGVEDHGGRSEGAGPRSRQRRGRSVGARIQVVLASEAAASETADEPSGEAPASAEPAVAVAATRWPPARGAPRSGRECCWSALRTRGTRPDRTRPLPVSRPDRSRSSSRRW